MNWDSIKYIFQIPLSWYEKIHKRVFNAYGTNFLTVREGYYGGTEIAVDSDGFTAEVNRVIDLSGYVKSVDGQEPDSNGAVSFGLTASKWVKTDSSGHLTTTNDTPVTLPSGTTGRSGTVTFVTGVSWNGTQIVINSMNITFTNGVATNAVTQPTSYINTVAYAT